MSVMLLLLGASLLVGVLFLVAFIWSVKSGQMDDTYSPAHKLLFDNFDRKTPSEEEQANQANNKQTTTQQ